MIEELGNIETSHLDNETLREVYRKELQSLLGGVNIAPADWIWRRDDKPYHPKTGELIDAEPFNKTRDLRVMIPEKNLSRDRICITGTGIYRSAYAESGEKRGLESNKLGGIDITTKGQFENIVPIIVEPSKLSGKFEGEEINARVEAGIEVTETLENGQQTKYQVFPISQLELPNETLDGVFIVDMEGNTIFRKISRLNYTIDFYGQMHLDSR